MGITRRIWKLLLLYVGFSAIFILVVAWLIVGRYEPLLYQQQERRLLDVCRTARVVVSEALLRGDIEFLRREVADLARETGLRVTVIAADGRVYADSSGSPEEMDNHLDRVEVREASGPARYGIVRRSSTTLGKVLYYCAAPIVDGERPGGYVRVAVNATVIEQPLRRNRMWLAFASVAALAATGTLTYFVTDRMARPVDELALRVARLSGDNVAEEGTAGTADAVANSAKANNELDRLDARIAWIEDRQARRADGPGDAARLANLLAHMAEGVLALDAEQRIILANEAARRLLEFSAGEIEGRPLWEVMRNRSLEEAVAETLHSRRPCTKEFEAGTAGNRRILTLRASPLSEETSPGVMIVLHDVSDLRRLENLRREFVANVSHELKTPLASIKAYAETLRMGAVHDPEHNVEFVSRIEEQSDRLNDLILDLLQLARVESGQEAFEITTVLVPPVVEGCVRSYESAAAAKRISLELESPKYSVWVRADEEGLRTILSNLVDNAIKYTPDGGKVTIRWGADDQFGWIEVQDTGIGIGKQHHARIFERFYRVDKARSREVGGTGLGLSIVKHLTQAFGGTVRVESQLRSGSTFRVVLPLDKA